jgi:hypothetical protein
VPCSKGRHLIEKEQLCVKAGGHQFALSAFELQKAGNPGFVLEQVPHLFF